MPFFCFFLLLFFWENSTGKGNPWAFLESNSLLLEIALFVEDRLGFKGFLEGYIGFRIVLLPFPFFIGVCLCRIYW